MYHTLVSIFTGRGGVALLRFWSPRLCNSTSVPHPLSCPHPLPSHALAPPSRLPIPSTLVRLNTCTPLEAPLAPHPVNSHNRL